MLPKQGYQVRAAMKFGVTDKYAFARSFCGGSRFEHGIGLANPRGVPEENSELPSAPPTANAIVDNSIMQGLVSINANFLAFHAHLHRAMHSLTDRRFARNSCQ